MKLRGRGWVVLLLGLMLSSVTLGQEPVFSGPQVGEKLPPLPIKGLVGEWEGKRLDALEEIGDRPALIVFFHTLTRPAFGMTRGLVQFAASKQAAGMQTVVVFLTNDPTKTERWSEILPRQMPPGAIYGMSLEGIEGPGAYGLNRNVTLTILVAHEGKVTANAALAQPQLQADGPQIVQAIVDATGGGPVPAMSELEKGAMGMAPQRAGARGVGGRTPQRPEAAAAAPPAAAEPTKD